jgi:molybdopterin-guanine dinucleotide biosynthesis protein A
MSPPLADIAGLLIAGGKSLRFGVEKATTPLDGRPLMELAMRVFRPLSRVAVSARPGSGAERHTRALGLVVLHDDPLAPSGPLAGLAAGLEWARREGFGLVATAPCDTPLLPSDLVTHLASEIGDAPAAFAVTEKGEHPLCALWRAALADEISSRLRVGEHPPVRAFLRECGAVAVRFENAAAFSNANTREALAALARRT